MTCKMLIRQLRYILKYSEAQSISWNINWRYARCTTTPVSNSSAVWLGGHLFIACQWISPYDACGFPLLKGILNQFLGGRLLSKASLLVCWNYFFLWFTAFSHRWSNLFDDNLQRSFDPFHFWGLESWLLLSIFVGVCLLSRWVWMS